MKRLNFTLDSETVDLLNRLSEEWYKGNKSQTVRAALESLAAHAGKRGWIVKGYTPDRSAASVECHECGSRQSKGNLIFRPVFERSTGPSAIENIPNEEWVECVTCLETKQP